MEDQLTDEIAKHLFDGYTRRWSSFREEKIRDGRPTEPDVSAIIAAFIDDVGTQVTNFLSAAGGHTPDRENHDYYLTDAREPLVRDHMRKVRAVGGGRTSIQPDIFVCRESKTTGKSEIVVAVELKRDAAVNYIDCPTGEHSDYSNQLVCYAHGCWLADPADHPELTYVWLAPERKLSDVVIEAQGLSPDSDRLERLHATPAAYERQVEALATKWHRATVEDLADVLRPGSPNLAELIDAWAAGGR